MKLLSAGVAGIVLLTTGVGLIMAEPRFDTVGDLLGTALAAAGALLAIGVMIRLATRA